MYVRFPLDMSLEALFIFLCLSGATSLFSAGATGNLYFPVGEVVGSRRRL
jgi:hypothetical protein